MLGTHINFSAVYLSTFELTPSLHVEHFTISHALKETNTNPKKTRRNIHVKLAKDHIDNHKLK